MPTDKQTSPAEDAAYARRELARRELARRHYRDYLAYVHGAAWVRTRMSDYLADQVQAFVEEETGNARDVLVIETPPQHGKSMTISETLPSWIMGRFPKWRTIEISYNDDSAERFGRKNLEKVEAFGKALFGIGKGSIWTKKEFERENGWGRMISRGIGSGITGHAANLMIIDDPIKNQAEADSQTYRDKLWQEWQSTLGSRLAAGGKVILIMTPWHEDDLAQRVIKSVSNVRVIRLPVEAEEGDLLGREVGEPLCPELGKGASWLEQTKRDYMSDPKLGGARAWTALYQCSPRIEGGNIINRNWWRYYDPAEVTDFGTTVISVDATFKGKENNDYVAIGVVSKRGNNYYIRHVSNKHLDFPGTIREIFTIKSLYPESLYVLIEDKANGPAIIQTLQQTAFQHGITGIIPIDPAGGKVARLHAVAAAIEGGNVYLPKDAPWVPGFVDQFSAFPAGEHDDMVDMTTQALKRLLYAQGAYLPPGEDVQTRLLVERQEREALTDNDRIYDVYGGGGASYGGGWF